MRSKKREYYEKVLYEDDEYYVQAFNRLNETGKNSRNWAAFLFGPLWLFYRKIYFCDFIFLVIEKFLECDADDKNRILLFFISLGIHLLLGYLGTAWYYDVVKARIKEGYHLLDKYSPTSFTSGIFSFLGFFVCWTDQISSKSQLKTKVESEINENTIRAYLNSARENPYIVKVANGIIWLLLFVGFVALIAQK